VSCYSLKQQLFMRSNLPLLCRGYLSHGYNCVATWGFYYRQVGSPQHIDYRINFSSCGRLHHSTEYEYHTLRRMYDAGGNTWVAACNSISLCCPCGGVEPLRDRVWDSHVLPQSWPVHLAAPIGLHSRAYRKH